MNHGSRITAHGRRLPHPRWVCATFGKRVPSLNDKNGTHKTLYYHTLSSVRARCAGCATFFKFDLTNLFLTFLFSKSNFKSKLLGTHGTHLSNPDVSSLFHFLKLAHMLARTWHTRACNWHTPQLNTNLDQQIELNITTIGRSLS